MDEPLFSARRLVVHETFGRAGRLLEKVARGTELPEHHTVSDERGRVVALVRPQRRLLPRRHIYRLDVLDPDGVALLSLRAAYRRLRVYAADGDELGMLTRSSRRGAPVLTVTFEGPPLPQQRRRFIAKIERDLLATIRPRPLLPREAFGEIEVLDSDGAFAARAVNDDDRHDVVDIRPDLADPLRTLVVAFACSLADRRWMRWVMPNAP